ncbi:hypothetical protein AGABI1DRAFT_77297 [Agaricus bisporus var. burnettii JB137-S8]|uniref:F-box domain-containing protein n=1 Tax=Agaricus bisporus var. burnettii (strain JB137-S8 / ATCC MYA-4627 / FGSC 10392) TaxID=597362 RepID=K5X2D6_AGABU|nr:uncharacterized protein AGABI1DRAFT_77297 [Agaricus bisporus var. burnettii JB137-S8]EKM77313.1 hypothetical protein AGABI1DRAFT_77297 [Agaricus bisporus var. burnettii JB137-S8]
MPPTFHDELWEWVKGIVSEESRPAFTSLTRSPSHGTSTGGSRTTKHPPSFEEASKSLNQSWQCSSPRPATEILPVELWRKVLRYALRLTGAQSINLNDPFESDYIQEEYPYLPPECFDDRDACRRVCLTFDALVTEIMVEYIVVFTEEDLVWIVKKLEDDILSAEYKRLGDWTTRIDFCISGSYDPDWMLRLLTLTPNLVIYTTNTGLGEYPEHPMNTCILRGLVDFHGKTLRRLDWTGLNDAPTYANLHAIAKGIPSLTTLHLRHLYGLPSPTTPQPMLVFPSLKALSLGLIPLTKPPNMTNEEYPPCWDFFLRYFAHKFQLPRIQRLDIDICPLLPDFFTTYGRKIKTFRTSARPIPLCVDDALKALPNLQTFHYISSPGLEYQIPSDQTSLQRIAILSSIEHDISAPAIPFQSSIIKPLDIMLANIINMDTEKLTEVRICDRGGFAGIFESYNLLFWHWSRGLQQKKNIKLQNKYGDLDTRYAKYGDTPPPEQPSKRYTISNQWSPNNSDHTENPLPIDIIQNEYQSDS